MDYENFKLNLVEYLKTLPEINKFEFLILNKGYDENDAKKNNFPLTKGVTEFNDWLSSTNIIFFHENSNKLLGDILLVSNENIHFSRFDLKKLFEIYSENNDLTEVYESMKTNLGFLTSTPMDMLAKHSSEYDIIKSKLIIRPLKYDSSDKRFDEAVYKLFNDIALTLYFDAGGKGEYLLSAKIPKSTFDLWNKDFDEVFDGALENTYANAQPRMFNYDDFSEYTYKNMITLHGAFMAINVDNSFYEYKFDHCMPVTTTKKKNGAIALFYPGVKEKIADLMQSGFYTYFPSIDIAMLYSEKLGIEAIKENIGIAYKLGGESMADKFKNELLSKYLYKYDMDKKELIKVEEISFLE